MNNILSNSSQETNYFGINVARLKTLDFENDKLYSDILSNKTDIILLDISSNNEEVINKLESINLPYSIQYISIRCSTKISEEYLELKQKNIVNYEFIQYDSKIHYNVLFELSKLCMDDVKKYFYNHPFFTEYITTDNITHVRASYACTFDNNINKNKVGFLAQDKNTGKIVGFFLLEILDDNLVLAYMGGVHPSHRMSGIGHDGYLKIIQDFLIPNGFKKFAVDMQIQNIANMKSAGIGGKGLYPSESYLRINLFPFINVSKNKVIRGKYTDSYLNLIYGIKDILQLDSDLSISNFRHVIISKSYLNNNEFNYEINTPIYSNGNILILLKILRNKIITDLYYISYK